MTKQINTIKLAEHITNKRLHSSSTTPHLDEKSKAIIDAIINLSKKKPT